METQTRLSRHNKSVSAENIIAILSVAFVRMCVCVNKFCYSEDILSCLYVWFPVCLYLNGISAFVRYLMPKVYLLNCVYLNTRSILKVKANVSQTIYFNSKPQTTWFPH